MKNVLRKCRWLFVVCFLCIGMLCITEESQAASQYKIRINKQQNCVTVYKINEKGEYEPYKAMVCSVGTATPLGNFNLKEKIRWHILDGPVYGQYCTRITGHILFHSVWYYKNFEPSTLSYKQFNKLGQVASHGCIRLCVRDSKWIYDNCSFGTPVEIYNAKDPGPLGKPEAIKLSGWSGWDPTDETNPDNPYNNKKPSIVLKKGKAKIPYASEFKILKTITAKNTTGFDVIDKVKYTIKYKTASGKFKKVKKVNTYKAGVYKVAFKVTDQIGRKASLTVNYTVQKKIPLKSITLNRTSKNLYIGSTEEDAKCRIKLAKYKPAKASIKELKFYSSNPAVATVDEKGYVKAVSLGTAVITAKATDGSKLKAYCTINVKQRVVPTPVPVVVPTPEPMPVPTPAPTPTPTKPTDVTSSALIIK